MSYENTLNTRRDLVASTKDFKEFCDKSGWMDYEQLKNGWVPRLYDTIKMHPNQHWDRALLLPQVSSVKELFKRVEFIPERSGREGTLLFLWSETLSMHIGGKRDYSENGTPRISGAKFTKPFVELTDLAKDSMENFGKPESVRFYGRDSGQSLVTFTYMEGIGTKWVALVNNAEEETYAMLSQENRDLITANKLAEKLAWPEQSA